MRILMLFLVFSVYLVSCTKDIHEKEYTDINSESNDLNSKSNSTIETNYYSIQSVDVPFKNVDLDSKYSSFFLEIKKELDTRDLHGVSNYLENIGNLDWEKSIIFIKNSENISMVTPLIDIVNQKISGILYSYKQASKINFEFVEYTILLEEITNRPDEIRSKKLYNDILFVNFFSYYKYGQTIFGYSDILVGLANNITDHLRYEPILTLEPCDDPFADNTGCVWVKGLGGYYRIVKRWKFNWSAGFNKSFGLNGNLTTDWLDSDGGGSSTDTNNNESLRDKLFKNPLNKILKTMVNRVSLEFINNLGLNMTLDDLYEIVPADCYTIPNDPLDSEVSMDEDCVKDAIVSDFETRNNITLTLDERKIIKDNPFLTELLQEYMDCMADKDPDPNRRNLGRIANMIRDLTLDSEIEKRMFEKFMLGDDSIEAITPEECVEIMALIQNDPSYNNWNFSHEEIINGETVRHWTTGLLSGVEKFNYAIGATNFTTNDAGDVIGISDTYNFDIHLNTDVGQGDLGVVAPILTFAGIGCRKTVKAEWGTRIIAVWAAIKWRSKPYEISCP